jgi:SNARE protein
MTEEIRYYEEELNELLGEVERGFEELRAKRKGSAAAKSERISELTNRLQRAKQVLQSFKVEMRDLPRDHTGEFEVKAREFNQRLQQMQADLQSAKQESERAQVVGVRTVDEMSTQEVLQEASRVQDMDLTALQRMKRMVADSKAVGSATAAQLEDQTRQLKNIDADIMKVKSNLSRADLLVRAFVRKMATDKIIMIFLLCIFIGVAVIIVYKIVDPQGAEDAGLNVPDEVVDPLGSRRRALAAFRKFSRASDRPTT